MRITASGRTDRGQRRENNEDALLVDLGAGLFAVADGVGGHAAGEVASRMLVEGLAAALRGAQGDLCAAIRALHADIQQTAQSSLARHGMATTVVALQLDAGRGVVANVGDSRAYRLRGDSFEQLSLDHNLAGEQRRLGVTELYPGGEHILTMVLGGETPVVPHLQHIEVVAGDRLLLCSDGLTGMVDDATIAGVVAAAATPEEGCRQLVDLANAAGGRDNITVVLVFVEN